jgi:hypothetical protein
MRRPAEIPEVMSLLEQDMKSLHPAHGAALEKALVPARRILVADSPGESVVAVASIQGKLLYWSDTEDGWELDSLSADGSINSRGCSQLELGHITHQVFGEPSAA